jgi:hypothetical protein
MSDPYKYQLVIQLSEDCPIESADFEDDIADRIGNPGDDPGKLHMLNGHSIGGTMEFFVHTNAPKDAFALLRPLLEEQEYLRYATVAYRELSGEEFTVIWPEGFTGTFQPY